jgi:nucleoside-diphosphate-sugar epimerase
MNVLVTGAFGYLGIPLLQALVREGHSVTGWGNPPRTDRAMAALAALPKTTTLIPGNVLTAPFPEGDFDAVIHLAAAVRVGHDASERGIPQRILASTLYVYGPHTGLAYEQFTPNPETLYGTLKYGAEIMWRSLGGRTARLANLYGVSPIEPDDVLHRFRAHAWAGTAPSLYFGGAQRMDLLHLNDACAGLIALACGHGYGHTYNLGGSRDGALTVADLAAVAQEYGAAPPIIVSENSDRAGAPPPFPRILSIRRAQADLGWAPRVAPKDGLRDFFSEPAPEITT